MNDKNLTMTERLLNKVAPNQVAEYKKTRVMEMFNKMVLLINKRIDFAKYKNKYFPNEDRTLEFNIDGLEELDTGFVFKDGKVRTIKKLLDRPTCTFRCSEDVFLLMATHEMTFPTAYFYGYLDISGEHALRDYEIFKEMFNEYGHILVENGQ